MNAADLSELAEVDGRFIYSFCYRLTGNRSETEDLYQETFLKATEICNKINKNSNPKSFLISIAVGLWKNKCRKLAWRQKIVRIEEFTEASAEDMAEDSTLRDDITPEDIAIKNELCRTVREAVNRLNDKLRLPLYMYYTAQLSVDEIASVLKLPVGTVKSRLHKARNTIKTLLEVSNYEGL